MSDPIVQPLGTLIWTDDFESYAAGAVVAPWTNTQNSSISTAQPHGGTKSLALGAGGVQSNCNRAFGSTPTQWYADFWMWVSSNGDISTGGNGIAFPVNSAFNDNSPCVKVDHTGAGRVGLCTGGFGTAATWFTFSGISLNTWHHYLLEITSAAAGTAKLTVDGTVVGTYSGDTRNGSLVAGSAYIFLHAATIGPSPPAEFYVDDLSIYSGAAAGAAAQAMAMILA